MNSVTNLIMSIVNLPLGWVTKAQCHGWQLCVKMFDNWDRAQVVATLLGAIGVAFLLGFGIWKLVNKDAAAGKWKSLGLPVASGLVALAVLANIQTIASWIERTLSPLA